MGMLCSLLANGIKGEPHFVCSFKPHAEIGGELTVGMGRTAFKRFGGLAIYGRCASLVSSKCVVGQCEGELLVDVNTHAYHMKGRV